MYVAAKTLLQLNPCSLGAKFRIDLMHEKIRLTDGELSPWENRYSLNALILEFLIEAEPNPQIWDNPVQLIASGIIQRYDCR